MEAMPWHSGIKLYGRHYTDSGVLAYPEPLLLKKATPEDEGMMRPEFLNLPEYAAQNLMDELWRVGLRPSEGSGSAGSLAATERHLKDMQRIVFKEFPK